MSTSPKAISFSRKAKATGLARRVSSEFTFATVSISLPRYTHYTTSKPSQYGVQSEVDIAAQGGEAVASGTVADATTDATPTAEALQDSSSAITVVTTQASAGDDASATIKSPPVKKSINKRKRRDSIENISNLLDEPANQLSSGMAIALRRSKKTKLAEDTTTTQPGVEPSKLSKKVSSSKGQKGIQPTKQAIKENAPVQQTMAKAKSSSRSKPTPPVVPGPSIRSPNLEIAQCPEGHPTEGALYCTTCVKEYEWKSVDWLVRKPNWVPKDLWERVSSGLVHHTLKYVGAHGYLPHQSRDFTPAEWRLIEALCVWAETPGFPLTRRGQKVLYPSLEEVERQFNVKIPKGVKGLWGKAKKVRVPPVPADAQLAFVFDTGSAMPTPPQDAVTVVDPTDDTGSGGAGAQSLIDGPSDVSPPAEGDELPIDLEKNGSNECSTSEPLGSAQVTHEEAPSDGRNPEVELHTPESTGNVAIALPISPVDSTGGLAPGNETGSKIGNTPSSSLQHASDQAEPIARRTVPEATEDRGQPTTPANDPNTALEGEAEALLRALCEGSRSTILAAAYSRVPISIDSFKQEEHETVRRLMDVLGALTKA